MSRVPQWTKKQAREFGRRLRATREAAGLSQRDLSFPGCTAAYISRVEKGERYPSVVLIRGMAARLAVSADFLERGEETRALSDVLLDRLLDLSETTCIALRRRESSAVELRFALEGSPRRAAGGSLVEALDRAVAFAADLDAARARLADLQETRVIA